MKSIYLVMYLLQPEGSPLISTEIIAEMASEEACQAEVAHIKALPYVGKTMSGYYQLDASCHDADYIKRVQ